MTHPSKEWIDEAASAASPEGLQGARRRHLEMASRFQARAELEGSGFLQALLEIEGEAGLYPPSPPTVRGRIGGWLVRMQGGALWWLLRALRLRDRALRGACDVTRRQAAEIRELRERVERLEGK
jgi:hypothetical protein